MGDAKNKTSRRMALESVGMIIAAAAIATVVVPKMAHMISKARVRYQDHPRGDEYCADCVNFIPGPTPAAKGTCMIVEGAISPRGWCTAFASRPSGQYSGER
ncbi:MAG: high-potential iron-sulfur protein [Gammaproteobacteria bacterium]|nr:high-potential iron-sulfur protein [Gammaproteobacteria bacterium]